MNFFSWAPKVKRFQSTLDIFSHVYLQQNYLIPMAFPYVVGHNVGKSPGNEVGSKKVLVTNTSLFQLLYV